MFVGRGAELQFLESHYNAEGSRILVLYGRKGVGKTALLKAFAQGKNCAYYVARSCSEREQRFQWSRELAAQGHFMEVYPSYETLLQTSISGLEKSENKSIIILDEFHHFVKADPDFMQHLIQFTGSRSDVLVVLCSSASGWIENSMISKMGRSAMALTALMKVRELKFREMRKLYPGYSLDDAVKIYAALGGNPGLWNSFSEDLSARENMIRFLVSPGSRLFEEMNVCMAEELREPAVYNTILATMASGYSKLNDLFVHTGFSRAKISVYLKNLMELDFVEKVFSFESGGYENTQKGIYRISNSYVEFYYRFLYPFQSAIQSMDSRAFFEKYVEPAYAAFTENAYRRICCETLQGQYTGIGEWIGKNGTIDIVAHKENGGIMTALCRYAASVTDNDYEHLQACLKQAKLSPAETVFFTEQEISGTVQDRIRQNGIRVESISILQS